MLRQVVIYKSPSDYVGQFVAREWFIERGKLRAGDVVGVCTAIEPLREKAEEEGLVPTMRAPDDDPCIVEVWI